MINEIVIFKITKNDISEMESRNGVVRVDPVMGGELPASEYFSKILPVFNKRGQILSPGEVGCTLAHLGLYKTIVENDQPAIILENDIAPTADELVTARMFCAAAGKDFVHLGWHPNRLRGIFFFGKSIAKFGKHTLFQLDPSINMYGTYAYFVTPKAAGELLAFHQPELAKADSWARFFAGSDIVPYFAGVFEHPDDRGSLQSERTKIIPVSLRAIILRKIATFARGLRFKIARRLRGYRPINFERE